MSRLISDLLPEVQELYYKFHDKMIEVGIPYMVTSTYRSQEEQEALYARGRTAPGQIVTWTRNSRHTSRKAFDIAICYLGKPCWDVKVDIDWDEIPDYNEAGMIATEVGLEWGGYWRNTPDYCHFQLKEV